MPELKIGQAIRMSPLPNDATKTWKYGTCIDKVSSRSYIVDVNGHLYRRNRKYLRDTPEVNESNSKIENKVDNTQSVVNNQTKTTAINPKSNVKVAIDKGIAVKNNNNSITDIPKPEMQPRSVNTRSSMRQTKMPTKFKDYIMDNQS